MLITSVAVVALLLAIASGILAYQAVREVRASAPKQVMDALADLQSRVAAAEELVGLFRTSIIQWEANIGGVLEAVEDTLARTDTKRRRVAATEQRIKQREEGNAGDSDAALLSRAREQGLL